MITMPGSPYNTKDMLTSFTIPSTTDQDECTRHSSLDSQALGIMNLSLAYNILMHGKKNTESLRNYLCGKYGSPGPASVFADYQCTRHFQISGNSDPALQITELDTLYTRLEGNKCNVPSLIRAMTLLSAIPQSWDNLATSILTSQTLLTQLTWDFVSSAIQSEFSWRSTSSHTAHHSGVPRGDRPPSWKKNSQDKQQQRSQGQQQQQSQGDSSQQQKKKHGGKAHQADGSSKSVNDDEYQASSTITFASMATIIPPTHLLPSKPQSKARAPKLADQLSEQCPSQIGPIHGLLVRAQDRALKLYDECLARKFPDPTLVEAPASKITKPSLKAPPPQVQTGLSKMDIDPPSVSNTSILGESANADDVVSLGSPKDWDLNNQISGCDLYMHSSTVFFHSLTISA